MHTPPDDDPDPPDDDPPEDEPPELDVEPELDPPDDPPEDEPPELDVQPELDPLELDELPLLEELPELEDPPGPVSGAMAPPHAARTPVRTATANERRVRMIAR